MGGACEAPFERALTLLALTELRLIMGMTDEAAALLKEVRGSARRSGRRRPSPAPTPSRPTSRRRGRKRLSFMGLTERELDVLHLLPEDLTLEQIAARLFISYSTVKTHLDHIRNKSGSASAVTSSPGPPNSGSSLLHTIPRPRSAWGMADAGSSRQKSPAAVDARARCEAHPDSVPG